MLTKLILFVLHFDYKFMLWYLYVINILFNLLRITFLAHRINRRVSFRKWHHLFHQSTPGYIKFRSLIITFTNCTRYQAIISLFIKKEETDDFRNVRKRKHSASFLIISQDVFIFLRSCYHAQSRIYSIHSIVESWSS